MPYLRCTRTLLKKMNLTPPETEEAATSTLGDWYANLFRIGRRQCLIFVNEGTLLSFIAYGVSLTPKAVTMAFLTRLNYVLIEEGIAPAQSLAICQEYQTVSFSKTRSRSILGSMNDLVRLYDICVQNDGGLGYCDMSGITAQINRTPQRNLECTYAITAARQKLGVDEPT